MLVFEYTCRFSCPVRILTDQWKCFEAELFKELLALLDIDKSRTTPYYPRGDGNTERVNRTLESMLRCFIQENLWDDYLPPLAFAHNTKVHATTKVLQFEMDFGRQPRLPIDLIFPTQFHCHYELEPEDFVKEKENAIKKVFEFVVTVREGNIARQKFLHDRRLHHKRFNLLDRVFLKNDKLKV